MKSAVELKLSKIRFNLGYVKESMSYLTGFSIKDSCR